MRVLHHQLGYYKAPSAKLKSIVGVSVSSYFASGALMKLISGHSFFGKRNGALPTRAVGSDNEKKVVNSPMPAKKVAATSTNSSTRSTSAHVPSATRPRVSFRDEDDLDLVEVYPALSNDEYDRQPVQRADKAANVKELYCEIATFCEREMEVHRTMKHTVKHAYLHGKGEETRKEIRRKLRDLTLAKMGINKGATSMRI